MTAGENHLPVHVTAESYAQLDSRGILYGDHLHNADHVVVVQSPEIADGQTRVEMQGIVGGRDVVRDRVWITLKHGQMGNREFIARHVPIRITAMRVSDAPDAPTDDTIGIIHFVDSRGQLYTSCAPEKLPFVITPPYTKYLSLMGLQTTSTAASDNPRQTILYDPAGHVPEFRKDNAFLPGTSIDSSAEDVLAAIQ